MIKHVNNKIQNAIQLELFKAKKSIKIAVAWFTNELLLQPLILKQQSGVSVEIIINDDEINRGRDTSLDFSELISAGGVLRWNTSNQLMHDKFCVIDDRVVITGSYNWTNKAEYNNEVETFIYDEIETTSFFLDNFKKLSDDCQNNSRQNSTNSNSFYEAKGEIQGDFFIDRNGAKYSKDKKILIKGANVEKFIVDGNAEIIKDYAFEGCDKLDTIILSNIIEIEECAFDGCSKLKTITIPASVENIKELAFGWIFGVENTFKLYSINVADDNLIYDSRDNCNAIIETNNNRLVAGCINTIIPHSVKCIGSSAFWGIEELMKISIPDSVESIENDAFSGTGLTSLYIPNKVRHIDRTAFGSAFFPCPNLSGITVSEDNQTYDSRDNCNAVIESGTNKLIIGSNSTVVPKSVSIIGEEAFWGRIIEDIVIPNSVTKIERGAFLYCKSLKNVIIGDGILTIEDSTFDHCEKLKEVVIPKSVTCIRNFAFSYCKSLEKVIIGNSVKSIGSYVFRNCENLKTISIPNGLTIVDRGLFCGCSSLPKITIPETVTQIKAFAFDGCTSLRRIIIPNSVSQIEEHAFRGCTSLKSVVLPDSMNTIENGLFEGCNSLQEIIIPKTVTKIKGSAFKGCSSLKNIYIPDTVSYIGPQVFEGCESLKTITIPGRICKHTLLKQGNVYKLYHLFENCPIEDVTLTSSIPKEIFKGCDTLRHVVISETVTSIGANAFSDCTNLKVVTIPLSVTNIGSYAFSGCSSLQNIDIPESVTQIDSGVFQGCTSLKTIILPDSIVTIGSNVFKGCKSLVNVKLPKYVQDINCQMFSECSSIKNIIIPSKVLTIATEAFSGCNSLESIKIPDTVTSIANNAFYGCKNLNSIKLPSNLDKLHDGLFYGCESLTHIRIGNRVTYIGAHAFHYCTSLTTITIPESVKSIGQCAFSECSSLKKIILPSWIDCTGVGFDVENLDPKNVIYSDQGKTNTTHVRVNQAVKMEYSNIGFNGEISILLEFVNCEKRYICFDNKNILLNPYEKFIYLPPNSALQFKHYQTFFNLLWEKNLKITLLVSPLRKFVLKVGNSPKVEFYRNYPLLGNDKTLKIIYNNLINKIKDVDSSLKSRREAEEQGKSIVPKYIYFIKAEYVPRFRRDRNNNPILPESLEDRSKLRWMVVFHYSTTKNGKSCGYFYESTLLNMQYSEGIPIGGFGSVQSYLQDILGKVILTEEQRTEIILQELKKMGKIECYSEKYTDSNGKTRFAYNLYCDYPMSRVNLVVKAVESLKRHGLDTAK